MRLSQYCRTWAGLLLFGVLSIASANDDSGAPVEERLAGFMQQAADAGYTGSVIVARGDEVLLRGAWGERVAQSGQSVTPDTVATIGSITKQFTAAAVMLLDQRGKLSVTDRLDAHFGDVPADKASVTIHHLLSHQSGLPPAIGPDDDRVGRDAWLERAFAAELLFTPGEAYEYSNVGYSIAAAIVEKVSGEDYETFLRKRFFGPLGMDDTGYRSPDYVPERLAHGSKDDGSDWGSVYGNFILGGGPGWNLLGNGGIHSTPDDMLRWHRALQDGALLSAETVARLSGKYAEEPGGTWYGYGWSIEDTPWGATLVSHNGGNPYFFADFLRIPDDDIAIFLWTTSREGRLKDIGRRLAGILYGDPVPDLPPALPDRQPLDADTAEGAVAARMLDIVLGEDAALRDRLIPETIHPALLEKRDAAGIAEAAATIREHLGEHRLLGIRRYPDGRIDVEFDTVQGLMALELGLEDHDGLMVRSIGLRIGD